ncbi:MAG: tRNA 2-thiouridine(34) synthase MnmA, partial [Candidatus Falkowbacteria bacterium]|nr:tRNA 2-thiouridine(34) synthase MnmA [Candidatus Falkowbacteria bacterium]
LSSAAGREVGPDNKCCSLEAMLDAKAVAAKIGIELFTFDFKDKFKLKVVDNFLAEYASGRTPNPCIICNREIKIGGLLKYAASLDFDYVATGHYLKLKKLGRTYRLYKATDKNKDQSYFLYTFNQEQLSHLLFPLGNYQKPRVRELAKKYKLPTAEKKESQEICFIPGRHHNDFLRRHLSLKPGLIKVLPTGKVIGKHEGLALYTIGQRRGLIGGTGPYYAAKFDVKNNILYVVKNFNDPILYKDCLRASGVNWLRSLKFPLNCEAVIRYRHPAVECQIIKEGEKYEVKFKKPQRAVTPGQSVVFYKGQEVLGGGIIKS